VTLHAWAHALTSNEITAYRAQIPSLGVVLYPSNYNACREGDIAYVPSPAAAEQARDYPFTGFILGRDEPNVTGPSGNRVRPIHARSDYRNARDALGDVKGWTVPASLGLPYSLWRHALGCLQFDHAYHQARGVVDGVAWAPTGASRRHIRQVVKRYGLPHVLSPALHYTWRGWRQPNARWWKHLADAGVTVAIWSLEQWPTQSFGLFTQHGEMTKIGREVRDALA
jgi:hypothetical protein